MYAPISLPEDSCQSANSILTNHLDIVNQFANDAASKRGLIIVNPVADGEIHRCAIAGKSRNNRDGAYLLHIDDFPCGGFQNHTDGLGWQNWRADIGRKLTHQEIIAQQARIDEAEHQRRIKLHSQREKVAAKAAYLYGCGRPARNQKDHQYLIKKGIQPHGVKILGNALIVPLQDQAGRLVNLQFISPEGKKRFPKGSKKEECFFIIDGLSERILICEGYATGASLFEHSGQHIIVAFDAGNLLPVAKVIRSHFPDHEIIVCGDNDLSGVGQKAANEAALVVGGKVLIPPIAGMDWNDYLTGGCHV
ncbi:MULTISPECIES: toprim domain-containing protein [Nitrosomonas]|uniref:Putative DNA primase/helicase n=1 Tax=Nitrosomonas communis TaxID=44574 RepID=A0A5D3YDZ7_9PROT|nr:MULTISPECIES: toprim domain-containing protein [Nitrosomonas]TYP91151.1 putative DNA primase/helicase [Nitrosomonas communis]UVS60133.1 toprim domain-containing protein [Nitrosomonas sp. PLL12]